MPQTEASRFLRNTSMYKKELIKQHLVAYSFILPSVLGFLVFLILPVIATLIISFTDWDFSQVLSDIKFLGLANYVNIWKDEWFLSSLKNTLAYSFGTVPVTIILSLLLAILVEQTIRSNRDVMRVLLFIPYVTNVVVSSYVWQMVLSQHGPLAHLLNLLHIYEYPIWLGDPHWALPAIMLLGVWRSIGYVFVLYLAGLQNIPTELLEASTLDGASHAQKIFRITIPLLSPTTFFILTTQLIFSFRVFAQILVLTYGGPGTATSVLAFHIYMSAFKFFKMGYASTITWIMFIIIFCFTIVQWRMQKRWVYYY